MTDAWGGSWGSSWGFSWTYQQSVGTESVAPLIIFRRRLVMAV